MRYALVLMWQLMDGIYMHTEDLVSSTLTKRVRELMDSHGIVERKQSSTLARILGLSFSAAYRKLHSSSRWTVQQINQVAAHFKESPAKLLESLNEISGLPTQDDPQEAVLTIGHKELPCLAWIDRPLSDGQTADLVAIQVRGRWRIYEMSAAPEGTRHDVEKIELYPKQFSRMSIAVIEDDEAAADNITEYLNAIGFKATPYYSLASALAAVAHHAYDGYLIDWFMGNETAEGLIKAIRTSGNVDAPIFLLTSKQENNIDMETELARLIRQYDVDCKEKPARLHIIGAELSKCLNLY